MANRWSQSMYPSAPFRQASRTLCECASCRSSTRECLCSCRMSRGAGAAPAPTPLRSRKDRGFGSRETRPLVRRTRGQPADRDALYRMIPSNAFLLSAALMVLSVGHYFWRRVRAREIAERWLAQQRYRVRSLRVSYWSAHPRFRMTPFRNNDWAIDFRAEVDDMRLGGTGEMRLRVWTDWLGMLDREPEVSWVKMP